jgi:hypothetical protein
LSPLQKQMAHFVEKEREPCRIDTSTDEGFVVAVGGVGGERLELGLGLGGRRYALSFNFHNVCPCDYVVETVLQAFWRVFDHMFLL